MDKVWVVESQDITFKDMHIEGIFRDEQQAFDKRANLQVKYGDYVEVRVHGPYHVE